MEFVHLHTHSHYSLLDGLPTIDQLVARAAELKFPALALTDHGSLAGAIEFYQKARASGVKPIIGVETYLAPGSRTDHRPGDERPYHLTLLARTTDGYRNLLKLVTAAQLEGFYGKPRVDDELLGRYGAGLTILTGCLNGPVSRAILNGDRARARKIIDRLRQVSEGHVYLELQPRRHPDQQQVNAELRNLSQELGVPTVATNDSHYLTPEDAEAQDVLLCIQTKRVVADPDRLTMRDDQYALLTGDEMLQLMPDDRDAVARTAEVAAACAVEIELGQVRLPRFTVPAGKTADSSLRELCETGMRHRYGRRLNPAVRDRLDYELRVIAKTGFASYFLIVQDFVNWAKGRGIVVGPGRGSGAGSIVAYLTNITNIDPLKYDLLFERFLNPERIALPDFDIDFADRRRDEVIRYVESRYGKDHVAQIITFGTMAARAAVRDVGRALGFPYSYCDRVAKLIPFTASLRQAIDSVSELREIYENDGDGRRLLDTARKLEGVARHASVHACGVVISADPLTETVPLQRASQDDDVIVTQYSLHPIEDLGLLKVDFLGLANLTILEDTIAAIRDRRGVTVDLDRLPPDDRPTYALLQAGHTVGVFQFESAGMRRYLKELKPTEFEDLIAMVSLYRPGPMELIPEYIAGKHGRKRPTYLHPKLEPILEKTYGVAVYQEQLMRIARDLAGFTLGEADVLRKAVGKKIKKLLKEQREKFVTGCVNNGVSKATAENIFAFIEPFASYGFNRSHGACYALIAYQTAYCKAHYPAEFLAALLTADHANSDRVAIEIAECRAMSLPVLPPDVNESRDRFTVVAVSGTDGIRFGLNAVRNLGEGVAAALIAERDAHGPFTSLEDFLRRVTTKDLNRKSLEALVKSGALDRFGERKRLLENVEELLVYVRHAERETKNGQTNLFGLLPVEHLPTLKLHDAPSASKQELLAWEKELLGLYLTAHPLDDVADALGRATTPIRDLGSARPGPLTVGGVITSLQRILTRQNEPMLFAKLDDRTGNVEVVVFPSVLKDTATVWREDAVVLVTGKLSDKDGVPKVLADRAQPFAPDGPEGRSPAAPQALVLALPGPADAALLERLKTLLAEHDGPVPVYLRVTRQGETTRIATAYRVALDPDLTAALGELLGRTAVTTV